MKKLWIIACLALLMGCSPQEHPVAPLLTATPGGPTGQQQSTLPIFPDDDDLATAVAKVSPSVVGLAVTVTGGEEEPPVEGVGSGVIIHEDGYILTNHHVAGAATQIRVVFKDGSQVPGHLVWSDEALDLAVLRCEGGPYPAARMGDSDQLKPGQTVIAIGTPLDLAFQQTVTAGIVSAVNRSLMVPGENSTNYMQQLIQTDASINPGNSGGPLCDIRGNVVGINTVKVSGAEGIGFAIPINLCRTIAEKVISDPDYKSPYLGLVAIDAAIARYYGQDVAEGIWVLSADTEGPAYACGVRTGDCLLEVNGQTLATLTGLRQLLYSVGAGGQVQLVWRRGDTVMSGRCTLASR